MPSSRSSRRSHHERRLDPAPSIVVEELY